MADETAESGGGFGATVRAFAFDGDEVKYRSWEGKTLALASSKGFLLALTRESTGTVLTVEEFEYGQVKYYLQCLGLQIRAVRRISCCWSSCTLW